MPQSLPVEPGIRQGRRRRRLNVCLYANRDEHVTIEELVRAVDAALGEC